MRKLRPLWAAIIAVALTCRAAAAPLEVEVIQVGPGSLYANMALIKGEKGAVLIDAPFTRSDAHRVVAAILESGRTLETIYITHDHPDHFFSVDVIVNAFPNARLISAPAVVEDIWRSIPIKLKRWGPVLGANGPRHPMAPEAIEESYFELEGQRFEIIGPMQSDHARSTVVWIPSIKALIAGDLVFNEVHLWFGESLAPERAAWAQSLERVRALKPEIVVSGHKKPGLPDDASALDFTARYLQVFERAVKSSKSSAELMKKVKAAFPNTIDVLEDEIPGGFILGTSAQVALGEIPPWEE